MQRVLVALGCNNACVFCAQGAMRETEGERGDLEGQVVLASRSGGPLAFVGGEPTLLPDLPELIQLALHHGAQRVTLQTNARRLAYPAYTAALRRAGLSGVDVSLHGSTAAMHEFHTGVAGSFAQTCTGIAVARAAGLDVGVSSVVTRSNFRHLVELVRLAHARGVRRLFLSCASPVGRAAIAPSVVPAPEMVAPHAAEAARAAGRLGIDICLDLSGKAVVEPPWPFAGIGSVEPTRTTTPSPPRRPLPLLPPEDTR